MEELFSLQLLGIYFLGMMGWVCVFKESGNVVIWPVHCYVITLTGVFSFFTAGDTLTGFESLVIDLATMGLGGVGAVPGTLPKGGLDLGVVL